MILNNNFPGSETLSELLFADTYIVTYEEKVLQREGESINVWGKTLYVQQMFKYVRFIYEASVFVVTAYSICIYGGNCFYCFWN